MFHYFAMTHKPTFGSNLTAGIAVRMACILNRILSDSLLIHMHQERSVNLLFIYPE